MFLTLDFVDDGDRGLSVSNELRPPVVVTPDDFVSN